MQFVLRPLVLALLVVAPAHATMKVWSLSDHDSAWSSVPGEEERDAVTGESHFLPKEGLSHGEFARAECVETSDGVARWTIERRNDPPIETKSLGIEPCDVPPTWVPVSPR